MDEIRENAVAGVKVCETFGSCGIDFNRPVTRKLYEAAEKVKNIHMKRLIMAVPGFFTSAIVDPLRRVAVTPIGVAYAAHEDFKNLKKQINKYQICDDFRGLSWAEKRQLRHLKEEYATRVVTLPFSYSLATTISLVAAVGISAADIATSPVHTAWRVAKL